MLTLWNCVTQSKATLPLYSTNLSQFWFQLTSDLTPSLAATSCLFLKVCIMVQYFSSTMENLLTLFELFWFTDKNVPIILSWRAQSLWCHNACSLQLWMTGTFLSVNQNGSNFAQALLSTIWSYTENPGIFNFFEDTLLWITQRLKSTFKKNIFFTPQCTQNNKKE